MNRKYIPLAVLLIFTLLQSGCFLFMLDDPDYSINMYVSLGLYSSYPADPTYDGSDISGLSDYGGKDVCFEVKGVDPALNSIIHLLTRTALGWTGGDPASSTQYANFVADISENTMYLAGSYWFRIYIDWDGSGTLNSGDGVFANYNIYADTDNDPDTPAELVNPADYGGAVSYNASDYSITIVDPLSEDNGLSWIIEDMDAGNLVVY